MNILVIGSGGREHALVWKIAQSSLVEKIYAIPGNPGMENLAECVNLDNSDMMAMVKFAREKNIHLTVVGPEVNLVQGIADEFAKNNLPLFGPSKLAAELEGSKAFAKNLMEKYNIPTAFFKVCETYEVAKAYIEEKGAPIVIKADGLAAGKGVIVAMTIEEAYDAIEKIMQDNEFGHAGARVVIEEYLEGEEASLLAFTDGQCVRPMIAAQDHKRALDGDKGLNTGGMGTYAPAPVLTEKLKQECMEKVLIPIVRAMKAEGREYKGCLYAGLMMTQKGIKVIEFNARFGDPETQVVLPLLEGDLVEILLACTNGTLEKVSLAWKDESAVCVVMASGGYPEKYKTGIEIFGLDTANQMENCIVFHAGSKKSGEKIVTGGGRVLGVVACGKNLLVAQQKAYQAVAKIDFDKVHFRKDIAWRAI